MKNIQKLNLLLLLVLLLISSAVVYKWTQKRSSINNEVTSSEAKTIKTKETVFVENKIPPEEIDKHYEKVKFDRLIVAMRGHHSRDLEKVVAEGLDFTMLPDDAQDKLKEVAQEEDFQSLIAPLFENK